MFLCLLSFPLWRRVSPQFFNPFVQVSEATLVQKKQVGEVRAWPSGKCREKGVSLSPTHFMSSGKGLCSLTDRCCEFFFK